MSAYDPYFIRGVFGNAEKLSKIGYGWKIKDALLGPDDYILLQIA